MNFFAANLRYLRKVNGMSQQFLAKSLGVKRSNVAAYETKNVEPRLDLIIKMAQLFSVSVSEIICVDLGIINGNGHLAGSEHLPVKIPSKSPHSQVVARLKDRALETNTMLEGLKLFYEHKQRIKANGTVDVPLDHSSTDDVENFLIFIKQMLVYNGQVTQACQQLHSVRPSVAVAVASKPLAD